MKNKALIGVLTFFITIFLMILFLNLSNSKTKKKYTFKRDWDGRKELLIFQNNFQKTNESEHVMFVNSDKFIVERDIKFIDSVNSNFIFYLQDYNFKNKNTKNAILPNNANILFCNSEKIYYSMSGVLFEYYFETKKTNDLKLNNFKANTVYPLTKNKDFLLCMGQLYKNNEYIFGFFLISLKSKEIKVVKKLVNNEAFSENSLKYVGKLKYILELDAYIYCCEKYSKIFFFDNSGNFSREFETNEMIPLPKIAVNKEGNRFYSRDGTWYSNKGFFINKNSLFVLSTTTDYNEFITIDEYELNLLNYKKSYKVKYNKIGSLDIMNLYQNKNELILCLDYDYAKFLISNE